MKWTEFLKNKNSKKFQDEIENQNDFISVNIDH